jgi:hypothetical protein
MISGLASTREAPAHHPNDRERERKEPCGSDDIKNGDEAAETKSSIRWHGESSMPADGHHKNILYKRGAHF